MIRTANVLSLIVAICLTIGWTTTASAQSRGIAENRFLSPEKSMKSMEPQRLGLTDDSSKSDQKAAIAGLATTKRGKSLALRNGFGPKGSQAGVGQLQLLKNKETANHHVGEDHWETAFDGIEVKPGPSKGKILTGNSLQGSSSVKGTISLESSHGIAGDGWNELSKKTERLK